MEGLTIRNNLSKRNSVNPISILLLAITVLVLSLPTLIILLFSKEEDTQPPNDVTELVEILNEESELTVHVERSVTNEIESIPIEQYVASVVASEMPAEFELEALKAQALAARTYIIQYLLATGSFDTDQAITDTVQHRLQNQSERKNNGEPTIIEKWKNHGCICNLRPNPNLDEPITPAFFNE